LIQLDIFLCVLHRTSFLRPNSARKFSGFGRLPKFDPRAAHLYFRCSLQAPGAAQHVLFASHVFSLIGQSSAGTRALSENNQPNSGQ
jgi:hypothetical protein